MGALVLVGAESLFPLLELDLWGLAVSVCGLQSLAWQAESEALQPLVLLCPYASCSALIQKALTRRGASYLRSWRSAEAGAGCDPGPDQRPSTYLEAGTVFPGVERWRRFVAVLGVGFRTLVMRLDLWLSMSS